MRVLYRTRPHLSASRRIFVVAVWLLQADGRAPACGGYRCGRAVYPWIKATPPDWSETALADGVPGVATVVNHSIVWQYLSNVDRARFDRVMAMAGEAATYNKPLAWLRSEPADNVAEVRLQLWTGSHDRLLARSSFHGKPVRSG